MSAPTLPADQSARQFLLDRINYETASTFPYRSATLKLQRMRTLLAHLGDPQKQLKLIHIAGTKGKGSTAAMISSMLVAGGSRVGLYSSPHLESVEERFRINGEVCPTSRFTQLIESLRPAIATMDAADDPPTYFEITTAIALTYFAEEKTDAAIMEVGMGGRLDSTNVIEPLVSVITTISYDHTKQLGSTLAEIAGEKGGIIKPGIPVVIGENPAEASEVLQRIASERGAAATVCGVDFQYDYSPPSPAANSHRLEAGFEYQSQISDPPLRWKDLQVGMPGKHQAANAAAALATMETLARLGWKTSESAIRAGLASACCAARIEIVQRDPVIIIDAAHNAASISALTNVVAESFPAKRCAVMFAASRDKKASAMLAQLSETFDHLIVTRFQSNPRGAVVEQVAKKAINAGWKEDAITVIDQPVEALAALREMLSADDLGCITGSFFLCAELRPLLINNQA
ncbi:MAG: bifunctional folylpolyglutamate synthase/dihydrofolate synthase [bacterium]|nr:bifunctional folylpolyglutamate synthase/dihydrofolate synthase [bacterium]